MLYLSTVKKRARRRGHGGFSISLTSSKKGKFRRQEKSWVNASNRRKGVPQRVRVTSAGIGAGVDKRKEGEES